MGVEIMYTGEMNIPEEKIFPGDGSITTGKAGSGEFRDTVLAACTLISMYDRNPGCKGLGKHKASEKIFRLLKIRRNIT